MISTSFFNLFSTGYLLFHLICYSNLLPTLVLYSTIPHHKYKYLHVAFSSIYRCYQIDQRTSLKSNSAIKYPSYDYFFQIITFQMFFTDLISQYCDSIFYIIKFLYELFELIYQGIISNTAILFIMNQKFILSVSIPIAQICTRTEIDRIRPYYPLQNKDNGNIPHL